MSWADRRARLLQKAAPVVRDPFEPSLPHFVTNGAGGWVLTPYALAHCAHCGVELDEGTTGNCPKHQAMIDALLMPWETDR